MKFIYFFLLLVFIFSTGSCGEQPPLSGIVKISPDGEYAPFVYLIQPKNFNGIVSSYEGIVLDSAIVEENGSFVFNEMPDASEAILLQIAVQKKGERFLNKLENEAIEEANYFPFIWKNGNHLSVTANAEHFQKSFSIKNPSPQNAKMLQLRDIRQDTFQKYFSKKEGDNHEESRIIEQAETLLDFQQPLMDFANKTADLLPALVAIRWVSVEGDYERVPELLYAQCQKWKTKNPNHPWTLQLCKQATREVLPVMIGDVLPDFSMPMVSGKTIPLPQLLKQRLTILDLWASWCAPCRRENRDFLVPLWDKYHNDGFQIIGYALDGNERTWKSAIEKDGANRWLHASHLKGDDSPFFHTLNIKTIPANFLIDEKGKVIAKNLHGEDLVKFVDAYMK